MTQTNEQTMQEKVQAFRNDALNHMIKSVDPGDFAVDTNGKLTLQKATSVEQDNTKPITSAAVYTEVGNIEVLLSNI